MAKDYSKLSRDDLLLYIQSLEKQLKDEKYGLYWDKNIEQEKTINLCTKNIPFLQRNSERSIIIKNGNIKNNILIEGDNYFALTALRMISGSDGLVDAVYIDPPYNTGNKDFIYNDHFVDLDDGYRHSKWLEFMQKRLVLARELMKNDAVIFISIDDNEYANLKLLCDSIFDEKNYIGTLKWKKKKQPSFLARIAGILEYILVYAKQGSNIKKLSVESLTDSDKPIINSSNQVCTRSFRAGIRAKCKNNIIKSGIYKNRSMSIEYFNDVNIVNNRTINSFSCSSKFRTGQDSLNNFMDEDLIFITSNLGLRRDLSTNEKSNKKSITDLLLDWGQNQDGSNELKNIFNIKDDTNAFTNPKPVLLIKNLICSLGKNDGIVLDFFAGSGTTGQSVLELNKEDDGNRRFILCTNNENNICTDVTYPRLKTVITGIRPDGTKYSDGIPSNLIYYKCGFIKDSNNTDQAKYALAEKVDELLCILEDTFIQKFRNDYSSQYVSNDGLRNTFIYSDYYNEDKFNEFKKRVIEATGKKIIYMFSTDNTVDELLFKDIKNVERKPIPSKIYEIYKEIVDSINRG